MLLAKKLRITPLTFVLTMAFTCLVKWTIFLLIFLLGILSAGQIPKGTTCPTQLDWTFFNPFLLVSNNWTGPFLSPSSLSHTSGRDLFKALPPCPTQQDETFFKPYLLVPHIWTGPFLSPSSCPTQLDRTFLKPFLLVPHNGTRPFLSPTSLFHTSGRDLFKPFLLVPYNWMGLFIRLTFIPFCM